MVVALATLVGHPGLQLKVLTGDEASERPVHSVAVSELVDPTKYLMGGELVLTTGMWLPSDLASLDEYVDRLVAAGVVALGFGAGVVADSTPEPLVDAAARAGLTLLEVAEATPFVAVIRALAEILVAEERAEHLHVHRAHQDLSRAARVTGPRGVVQTLATQVAGDVLLVDGTGRVREWSSEEATDLLPALGSEISRIRAANQAATSIVEDGRHIALQALGNGRAARGVLVVSTDAAMSTLQRELVAGAAAILSFGLDQESPTAQRRLRQAALIRLVRTGAAPAPDELAVLSEGLLAAGPLVVVAARGPREQLVAWCEELQDLGEERALAGLIGDLAYALVAAGVDIEAALAGRESLALGASRPVEPRHLRAAFDDAERACDIAAGRGVRVVRYADLTRGALSVADPRAARSFAEEFLAPLDAYTAESGVDLRGSLKTWLDHHGHFDPAAHELGLHRHTLRQRINRAAQLLGRDLEDVETRFDLWFALQVTRTGPVVSSAGSRSGWPR
ncbi:PucR family transcriptional regulator [Nocardioides albidus]|nr:PucR family transcriptional regulator [Nocardioides albidus]